MASPDEVSAEAAAAIGFPKLKYAWVERERRWLCRDLPDRKVLSADRITDLYVTGTQLRLREAVPLHGGPTMRRLTRKGDLAAETRLLTSIYLTEAEFGLLAGLPGRRLVKVRHRLEGVAVSVDRFEGPLAGLVLAEKEFDTAAELAAFPDPDFALREVTGDPRYGGGALSLAERLP